MNVYTYTYIYYHKILYMRIPFSQPHSLSPSVMSGYNKKPPIHEPGSQTSPHTRVQRSTWILCFPSSKTVRNTGLLLKPPSVWPEMTKTESNTTSFPILNSST